MATPKNSQQALAQLQKAQTAAQNPQAILAQQQNQLGVGAQRNTVQGLRGAIDNTTKLLKQVAPSVMGRTQGSLVTNAQATRQIGNEQAPIAQNLNEQGQAYQTATADLGDIENQALQAAQLGYQGQRDRIGYLQDVYNTYYQTERDKEAKAIQDRAFREQQRQFNLTPRGGSSSGGGLDIASILTSLGGGAPKKPTLKSLFEGYNPKTDLNYTENTVIPTLMRDLGYTYDKATKKAYDYRRKYFNE